MGQWQLLSDRGIDYGNHIHWRYELHHFLDRQPDLPSTTGTITTGGGAGVTFRLPMLIPAPSIPIA